MDRPRKSHGEAVPGRQIEECDGWQVLPHTGVTRCKGFSTGRSARRPTYRNFIIGVLASLQVLARLIPSVIDGPSLPCFLTQRIELPESQVPGDEDVHQCGTSQLQFGRTRCAINQRDSEEFKAISFRSGLVHTRERKEYAN